MHSSLALFPRISFQPNGQRKSPGGSIERTESHKEGSEEACSTAPTEPKGQSEKRRSQATRPRGRSPRKLQAGAYHTAISLPQGSRWAQYNPQGPEPILAHPGNLASVGAPFACRGTGLRIRVFLCYWLCADRRLSCMLRGAGTRGSRPARRL